MSKHIAVLSDTHGLLRPEVMEGVMYGNAARLLGLDD